MAGTLICIKEIASAVSAFCHLDAVECFYGTVSLKHWECDAHRITSRIRLEHMQFSLHRNVCKGIPAGAVIVNDAMLAFN